MQSEFLVQAIRKLRPNAEFSFTDRDSSTIVWDKIEGNPPTDQEIAAAVIEVQNEMAQAETTRVAQKAALLERLGITQDEANLLLS
jgi:hypothetical protein